MNYTLISPLWLHAPDAAYGQRGVDEADLPAAAPEALATAFTHLFLLNVFPYGDVFLTPSAELNGPGAERAAQAYRAQGFDPPELLEVAAPDHLGLQLAFLDHLAGRQAAVARATARADLLAWAPAACVAVQREPGVHPFYAALARATLTTLLVEGLSHAMPAAMAPAETGPLPDVEGEVRLRDIAAFFLAPARCGMWLSRGRLGSMARTLGLALPFGPRAEVAESLFAAAGSAGQFGTLLQALTDELSVWRGEWATWPSWAAAGWAARGRHAEGQLALMREVLSTGR